MSGSRCAYTSNNTAPNFPRPGCVQLVSSSAEECERDLDVRANRIFAPLLDCSELTRFCLPIADNPRPGGGRVDRLRGNTLAAIRPPTKHHKFNYFQVICPKPPTLGAVVVVDPFSSGANLAAMVLNWGYKLFLVFSEKDSPVAKLVSVP